jgi:quinoprotein glucose dehydrogenase
MKIAEKSSSNTAASGVEAGSRKKQSRRYVLTLVLSAVALVLIIGGEQLIVLGGSAYYLLAGLAVAVSAALIARGDVRGIWVYGAMLAATLIWAIWESGGNPWGIQARIVAPAVLGLWVAAPYIRRIPGKILIAMAIALIIGAVVLLTFANRNESVETAASVPVGGTGDWLNYGNDLGGTRFSPVTQITPANVKELKPAWTFRTGVMKGIGFEATPLMVGNSLYLCTYNNIIFSLDPETGQQRWRFDPKTNAPPAGACRGVAYYKVADGVGQCVERIIFATIDARLMALDSRTGKPCPGFGNDGTVDLKRSMGDVRKGYYYVSSAPTIVRGKIILGGWVLDGQYVGEPSGVIRAFDAVTGQFAWAWDMDKPDFHGEPAAGETYSRGTANSWGPMSGDEALGLVYAPTGNATPDYWGARRSRGTERYASSVVALDVETGAARWRYQTVHHDLWDYDVSAQPTLVDLPIEGKMVPALIQATKRGQIFLLDRRNGRPLAAVEEKPVPQGPAPGDWLAPTQPFSTGMPSFDDTVLSERLMWGVTPLEQLWCRIKFKQARYEGPMTPPGLKPSITYPGYLGGINWGGVSVDPERRLMTVNWSRVANYTRLVPRAEVPDLKASESGGIHVGEPVPQLGTPFALFTGAFLSPLGVPCTQPPFGKIGVVDLDSRKMIWERPLGSSKDSGLFDTASHVPLPMGVPNTGGSLTTRTGLIFIAATQERAIRAYDVNTGKRLWWAALPAGGHASPMTYISPRSGRQFVVIVAGGNASLHSGAGDHLVAFALPRKN